MEDNSTILYCEKGVLKICNNPDYDIVVEMNNGENIYYKSGGISTNTNQMNSGVIDAFIECILKNKAPLISGEEGYKALAAVEACIRSSKESTWVKVENL
jgi:predicted dehydrogenase